ncbi:hypothetical protein SPRG_19022 [Saprolegnia parasitica CBS 223.65]|uniref:Uncharacterized protein n=1 Tax=Saprolegnia parasitica (strain CBS 223.65) TaxID=695850 RepID=A0A067D5B7_SAPPC|nr:hypothetical protein SPRG_19022 [Saprolegnia parasitica CBS 223.65]KDO34172.1 hypothetical protein SPRG_19022 [Saprolegnia parasitica CBS 223.65]|eukprot:XP_012195221.1 hypothetical protein SPRG_19022 [Saprolegnia parasitica CBS 223.65]
MEYDSGDSRNESEDDDEGLDDSKKDALLRPYAYAFARLRKAKDTFLYTLKCPSDVAPPRVHIGRTALAWPLTKAQEKRLQKRYATDTIISPAEFSIDDFDDWWASSGETVLVEGRAALGLKSSVAIGVTLSHLAIDVSGNGDVLRAQQTAPNTFGSVIFVLPSTHKGGRITFTQGHETEKFYAASSSTAMHAAMTYLQTWITSTRLTSGRRYALVFNLVSLGDAVPSMPPKMLEAIDMFQALAARPIQRHRRIARALKPINPRLMWDRLSYADSYLVDVLLATGAYDVALVRFRKVPDDQDMLNGNL